MAGAAIFTPNYKLLRGGTPNLTKFLSLYGDATLKSESQTQTLESRRDKLCGYNSAPYQMKAAFYTTGLNKNAGPHLANVRYSVFPKIA